jgi:hypothetical protein
MDAENSPGARGTVSRYFLPRMRPIAWINSAGLTGFIKKS